MVFAHDTAVSLGAAAALANTRPRVVGADVAGGRGGRDDDGEGLPDVPALDDFVRTWTFPGSRSHDDAEVRAVRGLRPVLLETWTAEEDRVVEIVNGLLTAGRALPQLVRHDGWDYHLHATPPEADLATRMSVEFAMALVDVVRAGELSRLRVCDGEDCGDLFVDASRNRSRRFCSTQCGNRAHVRAYRARRE